MVEKKQTFDNAKRNIEIEIVRDNIELLKKYKVAKTEEEKNQIMSEMDDYGAALLRGLLRDKKFTIDEFITRLHKAIELDSYRPRNLSLFEFALSKDLYDIGGEFDTFSDSLSKAHKEGESEDAIRHMYNSLTVNRFTLAKQFVHDWIRRLNANRDLVEVARNAKPDEEIDAYNKLFSKLARDFCDEYNFPRSVFNVKVVKDWVSSDVRPGDENANGCCIESVVLDLPKNLSDEEKAKIRQEFLKSPQNHPMARNGALVRINIGNIKKNYKDKNDFFYEMMNTFTHEMHHGLDNVAPSLGALGPQVFRSDKKTYVLSNKDY